MAGLFALIAAGSAPALASPQNNRFKAHCVMSGVETSHQGESRALDPLYLNIVSRWDSWGGDKLLEWQLRSVWSNGKNISGNKPLIRALLPKSLKKKTKNLMWELGETYGECFLGGESELYHMAEYLVFDLQFKDFDENALFLILQQMKGGKLGGSAWRDFARFEPEWDLDSLRFLGGEIKGSRYEKCPFIGTPDSKVGSIPGIQRTTLDLGATTYSLKLTCFSSYGIGVEGRYGPEWPLPYGQRARVINDIHQAIVGEPLPANDFSKRIAFEWLLRVE